jgi:hypothetical protein
MSGPEKAAELMYKAFIGVGAACSVRLREFLGLGTSAADVAAVLDVNPALCPRQYTGVSVEVGDGDDHVRVVVDTTAPGHGDPSWLSTLSVDRIEPIRSAAMGVDPHWNDATASVDGGNLVIDVRRAAAPAEEHEMVQLTRSSGGHTFVLEHRTVTPVELTSRAG